MKNLVIAIVCMFMLLIPWCAYERYSHLFINEYDQVFDDELIPYIREGSWSEAEEVFNVFSHDWSTYSSISAFFVNTEAVNEVDSLMIKTRSYIEDRDISNAVAETAYMMEYIRNVHENETPTAGNIF